MDRVGFERAFPSTVGIAEVVGSTPTRSTFINLVEYCIELIVYYCPTEPRDDAMPCQVPYPHSSSFVVLIFL